MDKKQKTNLINKQKPHSFNTGDKVLLANNFDTTNNPNLVVNWKGPAEIININDTNAKKSSRTKLKCSKFLN